MCLGDYGDPAALPILEGAIEDFEPDFDSPVGLINLADLIEAYERLGGPLPGHLLQRSDEVTAAFKAYRQKVGQPSRRAEKVGRNDPCPCGSGAKHKKCCLDKDREAASFGLGSSSIGSSEPLTPVPARSLPSFGGFAA